MPGELRKAGRPRSPSLETEDISGMFRLCVFLISVCKYSSLAEVQHSTSEEGQERLNPALQTHLACCPLSWRVALPSHSERLNKDGS